MRTGYKSFSVVQYNKDDRPTLLYPGGEVMLGTDREQAQVIADQFNEMADRLAFYENKEWGRLK